MVNFLEKLRKRVTKLFLIKNGKLDKPVKGATLIGEAKEVMPKISMCGNDLDLAPGFCGSISGSVNVTVGLATPPMGLILFVAAGLSDEPVEKIAWEMLPFLAIEIIVIFLITFVEGIPMTLPRLLGFA